MNISRHATERYVERMLNILGKQEIDTYIKQNTQQIELEIRELFTKAKLIYTGIMGGDNTECKFYVYENLCFVVTNDSKDTMKTFYKLLFPIPSDVQDIVLNSLLTNIKLAQDTYNTTKDEVASQQLRLMEEKDLLAQEIKAMEDKIKLAKNKQEVIRQQILCFEDTVKVAYNDVQNYAYQLFNNVYWKVDYK